MKDIKVFNLNEIKKNDFEDRWERFAFGPQGMINSESLKFGVVNYKPNKESLSHKHDIGESLFIISGKGNIKIDDRIFKIKNNDFVYIPQDLNHSVITGKDNLKILFIF